MLFNSLEFIIFFLLILGSQFFLKKHRYQKLVLLLGSYYFYAYWDWRFLFLILISTFVDYFTGMALSREDRTKQRRIYLIISLVVNLGLLGFFKYYNFFIDSLEVAMAPLGWNLRNLSIILPVGISFYTFQTLSYTIDVYRRDLKPCRDFADFALFVAFFPQLVAGPIVRARDFLPQLETPRTLDLNRLYKGFTLFTIGLFKKLLIADNLSIFVDAVFENYSHFAPGTVWIAVASGQIQMYCDFSGYSDMATGIACMLGYDFGRNFNFPFLSSSLIEFWRRWHISLSTWLRDYLYIPLGGNKKGKYRSYLNNMITMLLGGLWHGASWNFVIWGFWNGSGLVLNRLFYKKPVEGQKKPWWKLIAGILVTNLFLLIAFVFFRSADFSTSFSIIRKMLFIDTGGFAWFHPFALFSISFIMATHIIGDRFSGFLGLLSYRKRYAFAVLSLMWLLTLLFFPRGFQPFAYFQF